MNKLIFKLIKFYFLLFILLVLFSCKNDDKIKNNNTSPINNKVNYCDTVKPVGKIISSGHIKELDSLPRVTNKNLNDIKRYGAGSFIVAGDSGTILLTPNGGLNWLQPTSGTTLNLYGSVINDYDTMMVVGDSGKVIRSNNKGVTWNNMNSGTTKTLRSVCFPTKFIGYSSGDSGIVIKTTNAGLSWSTIYSIDTTGTIRSLYFADSLTGWFCTSKGRIYKSVNGGSSWSIQYSNSAISLNCISFNGLNKGTAVGSGGTILETNNSGSAWLLSGYNAGVDLNGVHRVNDKLAFLCGQSKIIREDSGNYTELINNPAYKFNAVDPDPYIMGLAVADLGLVAGVNVGVCDCSSKNDLVMFPTEENNKWRISIRLNNNSNYRKYLRVIIPGFEFDNTILTGWTQTDQVISTDPDINYIIGSSENGGYLTSGTYSITNTNDAITLNLDSKTSAFLNLDLHPTTFNQTTVGSVNYFFGNSSEIFCASVKYELSSGNP